MPQFNLMNLSIFLVHTNTINSSNILVKVYLSNGFDNKNIEYIKFVAGSGDLFKQLQLFPRDAPYWTPISSLSQQRI
jgi:hypothetical protein